MDRDLNVRKTERVPHTDVPQSEAELEVTPTPESSTVVFACSGCADTGALADAIARSLSDCKVAKMSCLAGIGGRVKSIIANAKSAHRILVIDGCSIECAKRTMQEAGLWNFRHLDLQELGFRKGASPVTPERVNAGAKAAKMLIMKY